MFLNPLPEPLLINYGQCVGAPAVSQVHCEDTRHPLVEAEVWSLSNHYLCQIQLWLFSSKNLIVSSTLCDGCDREEIEWQDHFQWHITRGTVRKRWPADGRPGQEHFTGQVGKQRIFAAKLKKVELFYDLFKKHSGDQLWQGSELEPGDTEVSASLSWSNGKMHRSNKWEMGITDGAAYTQSQQVLAFASPFSLYICFSHMGLGFSIKPSPFLLRILALACSLPGLLFF